MTFTIPVEREKLSRFKFRRDANPVVLVVDGNSLGEAKPRQSKATKSLGWGLNTKCHVQVGGKTVRCQVNFSLTIIGSKDSPEKNTDDPADAAG